MESIALSPFEMVTSDVATITDNVKTIDVANSPIESNKVQKNIDTTVDVKKMIMQLEKSGSEMENLTFDHSIKRKIEPTIIDETMNLQYKLDEVINTEKCVLKHLEKVNKSTNNNSELECKLLQIVNIETSMLQNIDKIIDKHDTHVDSSCLQKLEKEIISSEKSNEHIKILDTSVKSTPKEYTEEIIEKKCINTGYRQEDNIKNPIKLTGMSKELKQLIDEEEEEQERIYRALINESYSNDKIYSKKTPVIEKIITPKRVKQISQNDDIMYSSSTITQQIESNNKLIDEKISSIDLEKESKPLLNEKNAINKKNPSITENINPSNTKHTDEYIKVLETDQHDQNKKKYFMMKKMMNQIFLRNLPENI